MLTCVPVEVLRHPSVDALMAQLASFTECTPTGCTDGLDLVGPPERADVTVLASLTLIGVFAAVMRARRRAAASESKRRSLDVA